MSAWELPQTAEIDGEQWVLRTDYRAVMKACCILNDDELHDGQRAALFLELMYRDYGRLPIEKWEAALFAANRFISLEEVESNKNPEKLFDWEKDGQLIAGEVNKVLGTSVRSIPYLHWWDFIAAFRGIGDGQFATLVSIRKKIKHGKKLDKWEKEYKNENPELFAIVKKQLTDEEKEHMLNVFGVEAKG